MALPGGFTGILMGEFDYQKNPNDTGYHANFPALVNTVHEIDAGARGVMVAPEPVEHFAHMSVGSEATSR